MKKLFAVLVLFNCQLSILNCQLPYWQQQVNYTIDVSLNDKEHSLTGFEKIEYINNSPDTLSFIWFHIWPNAYKTDKTAFSDQLLENGITSFYFSDKEQKGYINRLDFKVNNITAKTEDHPQHIDILKLILPSPLPPGQKIAIATPFHVKLPYNYSRGGHDEQSYQATQWYPKPAVYDSKGWHPMPYLDQGEFYSEFGNFDVSITVPENYVVAATGELQNPDEKEWLIKRAGFKWEPVKKRIKKGSSVKTVLQNFPVSAADIKTLRFRQDRIHDFAWFADKRFVVNHDTCRLASGKVIDVYCYYTPAHADTWNTSVKNAKDAIYHYSNLVGEYPYNVVSVVQGPESFGGGMEYPTITVISPTKTEKELDNTMAHEIGHNWFYGILASNERDNPWMDEGINSFYDAKYYQSKYGSINQSERISFETKAVTKTDQPISTSSAQFSESNYNLVAYYKTAEWLRYLESLLGEEVFKKAMQEYFKEWQFKHPQPEDFKQIFETSTGKNLDSFFGLKDKTGLLPGKRELGTRTTLLFNVKSLKGYITKPTKNTLLVGPAIGVNSYDKLMIGALVTNYKLPPSAFQFMIMPLYATASKKIAGLGHLGYSLYMDKKVQEMQIGLGGMFFSKKAGMDSLRDKVFEDFYRLTPSIKLTFRNADARSTRQRSLEAKSFIVGEKDFNGFAIKSTDSMSYVTGSETTSYYINQLSFFENNFRALYPYNYSIQLQQGKGFYRANFTGNYFFNYVKGGGMEVRLFASKFGFPGNKSKYQYTTQRYQPKLLGITGEEDFTYSNYFIGRTASYGNDPDAVVKNRGLGAQQIMIRDGGFKLRLDQFDFLQGRSDNWVAAMNFNSTIPPNLLPFKLPVKLFLDVGTFSQAWEKDAAVSRFLFVSGVQLSLFKNVLNIYMPVLYSKEFKDNLKTLPDQNTFFKRITFSIDILNFDTRKINRALLL